jgi:xylitol oxidase
MMNKRTFLRLSAAVMGSRFAAPMMAWAGAGKITNWAGNIEYSTDRLQSSASVEQVRDFVRKQSRLKVLGTRHCFNTIADSKDLLLSVKELNEAVNVDSAAHTVTVDAGITYGKLAPILHEKGWALHNLASLPHISVAGACTTGTHGSGEKNGNLATAVAGLEFVTASGDMVRLSREKDGDTFQAAVVGLGALGVIKITLDVQPTFQMRQYVYDLPAGNNDLRRDRGWRYSVTLRTGRSSG